MKVDTFVLASGDADMVPLAARLQAYGKRVIVVTWAASSSPRLAGSANEVWYLDRLTTKGSHTSADIAVLGAELRSTVWRVQETEAVESISIADARTVLKRSNPSIDSTALGFASFEKLVVALVQATHGMFLTKDQRLRVDLDTAGGESAVVAEAPRVGHHSNAADIPKFLTAARDALSKRGHMVSTLTQAEPILPVVPAFTLAAIGTLKLKGGIGITPPVLRSTASSVGAPFVGGNPRWGRPPTPKEVGLGDEDAATMRLRLASVSEDILNALVNLALEVAGLPVEGQEPDCPLPRMRFMLKPYLNGLPIRTVVQQAQQSLAVLVAKEAPDLAPMSVLLLDPGRVVVLEDEVAASAAGAGGGDSSSVFRRSVGGSAPLPPVLEVEKDTEHPPQELRSPMMRNSTSRDVTALQSEPHSQVVDPTSVSASDSMEGGMPTGESGASQPPAPPSASSSEAPIVPAGTFVSPSSAIRTVDPGLRIKVLKDLTDAGTKEGLKTWRLPEVSHLSDALPLLVRASLAVLDTFKRSGKTISPPALRTNVMSIGRRYVQGVVRFGPALSPDQAGMSPEDASLLVKALEGTETNAINAMLTIVLHCIAVDHSMEGTHISKQDHMLAVPVDSTHGDRNLILQKLEHTLCDRLHSWMHRCLPSGHSSMEELIDTLSVDGLPRKAPVPAPLETPALPREAVAQIGVG